MSEAGNNGTIFYNSLFRHGVDDKRRVSIPSVWRPADADAAFTLILWPNGNVPDSNLSVLPPREMQALVEKVRTFPAADPRSTALRRLIGTKSASVTVDKSGRICIPEWMATAVGIEKEAVLVGLLDRFEIWSPERYENTRKTDEALTSEAFKLI